MTIFRCLIRGESFPFMINGAWKAMGFYTTRFVEAATNEEAEMTALHLMQQEDALKREPGTTGLEGARLFFEEIEEVEGAKNPNAGFTFFEEETS
jgi:hypothetical protein